MAVFTPPMGFGSLGTPTAATAAVQIPALPANLAAIFQQFTGGGAGGGAYSSFQGPFGSTGSGYMPGIEKWGTAQYGHALPLAGVGANRWENEYGKAQQSSDLDLRNQSALLMLKKMLEGDDFQNQLQMMREKAGLDLGGSLISSNYNNQWDTLNNIMRMGYADQDTINRAKGNFSGVQGNIGSTRDMLNALAQSGGFSPEEWNMLMGQQGQAFGNAMQNAQTGGDRGEYGQFLSHANPTLARLAETAKRGGLTDKEYADTLATTRQDTMDMARNAAESTFNQSLGGSGSPFAAASIMSKGAADTGRAVASRKADLDKYQSDTRLQADATAIPLMSTLGELGSRLASNRVSAGGQVNDAVGLLMQALNSKAGNKMDALRGLTSLLGLEGDIAGKMSELDMKSMPSWVRDLLGNVQGVSRGGLGSSGGAGGGFDIKSLFEKILGGTLGGGGVGSSKTYRGKDGRTITRRTISEGQPIRTDWGAVGAPRF